MLKSRFIPGWLLITLTVFFFALFTYQADEEPINLPEMLNESNQIEQANELDYD